MKNISLKRIGILLLIVPVILLSAAFASNVILTSFNSGELSPELGGRIDFNKYSSGLQTALNAIPMAQGGITRRPGTEYLGTTASNGEARLIPFVFSEDQAYVLEFGEIYMRVWADGGAVLTVDSNTKLLVHADDFDTSTTVTDYGTNAHTITATANAQQDTSQQKFGAGSVLFDGTGDYLSIADHADWYMAAAAYTIDFWVKFGTVNTNNGLWQQRVGANDYVAFTYNAGVIAITYDDNTDVAVTSVAVTLVADTWYHIALIRGWGADSDNHCITVDGTSIVTEVETDDWPDLAAAFEVGRDNTSDLDGWIDEFRVSKGVARWTANFDKPTFPHPSGGDDSGTVYSLTTPYSVGDLAELNFVQSADTMYIVHPDYIPYKLTRTRHDSWSITAFAWDSAVSAPGAGDRQPPWQDMNITTITLNPSATTGTITLIASSAFFSSGHVGAYFKMYQGFMKITSVTSSTVAGATVVDTLTGFGITDQWYESAWSQYRGFPSTIAFFEDRLVLANNDNQPQTFWMSESDDYEDWEETSPTIVDSDGITVTILAERINAIKWLISDRKLLIGTTGGEWWLTGDTSENAVTPTSILIRNATGHGSANAQPIKAGGATLFVQRPGKKVRQFQYKYDTDSYQATNLSVLAEHITDAVTIEEIVYQQQPHQLIWCRLSDGTLATLSYMPEHDVYAWARHTIGGVAVKVESLAVIPGTTDDELWMVVKQTMDDVPPSSGKRYIQRLAPFYFAAIADATYSDAYATYSGAAATSITGLNHLEGEAVVVLADGAVVTGHTVALNKITLATAASKVHVGLTYNTDIETMRLTAGSPLQAVHGRLKRINKVTARFYKTLSATAGPDTSNLDTITFSAYVTEEDKEIRISHGVDSDGVVFIRQTQPAPMTILALILDVEVY